MSEPTALLPPAPWQGRHGLAALLDRLGGGAITRLVGGAVRDSLLRLPVSDIDLATRLLPEEVMARLKDTSIKIVPTGLAHGTVTAVMRDGPIEVTTLRRDVATDGRHAEVAFSDDWRVDASRRDFTINALYADALTGEVYDWFDGVADLAQRRVRFIGAPLARIAEDHLRILRFFRFHARFGGGDPDPESLAACIARANDLMALSRERIASELLKLLSADQPVPAIRIMLTGGILRPVLPEIESADALAKLVGREAAFGVAGDPVRRLAALIGPDPDRAAAIAARLRLSNARTKRLVAAVGSGSGSPQALAYRLGIDVAIDRLLLGDGTQGDVESLRGWLPPALPIGGGALIARGLVAGPVVARTLARIENEWIAAGFPEGAAFEAIVAAALIEAN